MRHGVKRIEGIDRKKRNKEAWLEQQKKVTVLRMAL